MAGSVFQFQGIIVFRVGYRTVETIRFVVDAGTYYRRHAYARPGDNYAPDNESD